MWNESFSTFQLNVMQMRANWNAWMSPKELNSLAAYIQTTPERLHSWIVNRNQNPQIIEALDEESMRGIEQLLRGIHQQSSEPEMSFTFGNHNQSDKKKLAEEYDKNIFEWNQQMKQYKSNSYARRTESQKTLKKKELKKLPDHEYREGSYRLIDELKELKRVKNLRQRRELLKRIVSARLRKCSHISDTEMRILSKRIDTHNKTVYRWFSKEKKKILNRGEEEPYKECPRIQQLLEDVGRETREYSEKRNAKMITLVSEKTEWEEACEAMNIGTENGAVPRTQQHFFAENKSDLSPTGLSAKEIEQPTIEEDNSSRPNLVTWSDPITYSEFLESTGRATPPLASYRISPEYHNQGRNVSTDSEERFFSGTNIYLTNSTPDQLEQ
uniref:Homeobox domain-containing protein n=1 Tax=Caenorhabditis tropicalis TaxID=1561998 RepID=A0A1I7TLJ8_9PELO